MSTTVPKQAGLITLRQVVMSVLNRIQDYSMRQYMRLSAIAIEGFTEDLAMYHINAGIEVVYLHMSSGRTCDLPDDFVDYRKIGYPLNGKLRVISKNDQILLPRVFDDTGEYVGNISYEGVAIGANALDSFVFFQDHYRSGQFVGGMFGLKGGIDETSFRIDRENRQIVFDSDTPRTEVVLEYLSSGLKPDGSSLIPRQVAKPLRNYILWQKDDADRRISGAEKARLKNNYEESIQELRSFELAFNKEEYLRMVYSVVYQSPKR